MKQRFILSLLLLAGFLSQTQAQWIQTLEIMPATPTTADSVYLVATVQTPHSPCTLNHTEVTFEGKVIGINTCYANGMLTALCQRTDTIPLGRIEEVGSYELLFMANLTNDLSDSTCMPPFSSMMSSTNFMVDLANSVSETRSTFDFDLSPNPSKGVVNLSFDIKSAVEGQLLWFDQYGKKVFELPVSFGPTTNTKQINLNHLASGVYYCTFLTNTNSRITKKLVLLR